MIVVVPAATPYTTPVVEPMVPAAVLLLLQVPVPPDEVTSVSDVVSPAHTAVIPVIVPAAGEIFTVTVAVVVAVPQDAVLSVKVIVVVPGLTP